MRTSDLLAVWREAVRAAELTRSAAEMAERAARDADDTLASSEEVAMLAEHAAAAAAAASDTARRAAELARQRAGTHQRDASQANDREGVAAVIERAAAADYHQAEAGARQRHIHGAPSAVPDGDADQRDGIQLDGGEQPSALASR